MAMRTPSRLARFAIGGVLVGTLAIGGPLLPTARPAHADAKCAAACNSANDACMKSSNDRYKCLSQRNQCLKSCGGG